MKIRGFITNLGLYNEGKLVGDWIEFPIEEDELEKVLKNIDINEEHEEYFFTDWEIDDVWMDFGQYPDMDYVNDIAERLDDFDDYEIMALDMLLEEHTTSIDEAMDIIEKGNYRFSTSNLDDFIHDLLVEGYFGDVINPNWIDYLDYEDVADCELDQYYSNSSGTIIIYY